MTPLPRRTCEVSLSRRRTLRTLFAVLVSAEALIVLADIFLHRMEWIPWKPLRVPFDITREETVVNWFSSIQTFSVALVLAALFLLERRSRCPRAWGWAVLSAFFLFMSLDDGSRLHERIGASYEEMTAGLGMLARAVEIFPSYHWQMALAPFLIPITGFMAIFLWKQLDDRRNFWWVVVAICLLAIAVLMDLAEGADIFSSSVDLHYLKSGEEFIEMLGNTVFLIVFLRALMTRYPRVGLEFKK
jgi:hypothetical protein